MFQCVPCFSHKTTGGHFREDKGQNLAHEPWVADPQLRQFYTRKTQG